MGASDRAADLLRAADLAALGALGRCGIRRQRVCNGLSGDGSRVAAAGETLVAGRGRDAELDDALRLCASRPRSGGDSVGAWRCFRAAAHRLSFAQSRVFGRSADPTSVYGDLVEL